MPAFKRFGPTDQVDNVLVLRPKYAVASGSGGWRGSPEGSASLSLYGGARRGPADTLPDIRYQSVFPGIGQFGQVTLGQPLTASIDLVKLVSRDLSLTEKSRTYWGSAHWSAVQRLYSDYSARDPDYVMGVYDFYCLYFSPSSSNIVNVITRDRDDNDLLLTSSFTLESWVKPFGLPTVGTSFGFQSSAGVYDFSLLTSGLLGFGSTVGSATSSFGPTTGTWNHVAMSFDASSLSGVFYVNLTEAGRFSLPSVIPEGPTPSVVSLGSVPAGGFSSLTSTGTLGRSFFGMIGENRVWSSARTHAQLSASFNRRLRSSELTGTIVSYLPLSDGPNFRNFGAPSGTIDRAAVLRSANDPIASLVSFADRIGPTWLPSDNVSFFPDKTLLTASANQVAISELVVVNVPSAFYGRGISRGSVSLTCRAFSGGSYSLVRTLIDDGRGGLFVSGSMLSGSTENYRGVEWNKVGNVFYGEGLVVIKDPSLLDFGAANGSTGVSTAHPSDLFQLSFAGDSRIPVKTLMCRIDRGEFNASLNPTFRDVDDDGSWTRRHVSASIRVSTVGVYNSDRELVGIARLADPVRIRPRDRINIKIRMDF